MPDVGSVDGDVQHGSDQFAILPIDSVCVHELAVADEHRALVHDGLHAVPADLLGLLDAVVVDDAAVCFAHRSRDGVVRIRFGMSCVREGSSASMSGLAVDGGHGEKSPA